MLTKRIAINVVRYLTIPFIVFVAGCSGEYQCAQYAVIVTDDGTLHLYGSGCDYDYQVPLPVDALGGGYVVDHNSIF